MSDVELRRVTHGAEKVARVRPRGGIDSTPGDTAPSMTNEEKNALMDAARAEMTAAMALVIAEVYSGLATSTGLLQDASWKIRAAGDDAHADEAQARSNECPAIMAIPWPFIYIASDAWIAAVRNLRDSLPSFIDLQPASRRANEERLRAAEAVASRAASRWDALSDEQRRQLEGVGIRKDSLRLLP